MSPAITVSFVNFFLSLNTTLLLGKINTKHFNQTFALKHSESQRNNLFNMEQSPLQIIIDEEIEHNSDGMFI